MAATYGAADSAEPGLERGAIGLTEVLFQSITHMAPAVATALSLGAATLFAGGNTPLAVVLALIAALFTAYSIGELARHLPSAGGMYTYVARGLGSFFGWLMAWAFLLAEPVVPAALFASFGLFGGVADHDADRLLATTTCGSRSRSCAGCVVWWLVYRGISISTRVGVALGPDRDRHLPAACPLLLIINAGSRNTLSVFIPGDGRPQAGAPGHGLLPPRVRRVRGSGAAGRGDARPEADDPSGGPPVGGPDRPLLHLQHVRRDRVLRPGPDAGRLPRLQQRRPVERRWPTRSCRASAACS